MTAFIILREALLKNNNIGVIKSLKLMNFKCKTIYENIPAQDRHLGINSIHHLNYYY